jgi:F-type H+-transporting ATPase subunit delta
VTSGALAKRYARALFDVVLKESPGDVEKVQVQLQRFAEMFTGHPQLAGTMRNPAVPASKKAAVVRALIDRAGAIVPPLGKTILMLAERDRVALLSEIARAYRERVMDHLKVIRGEVTSAVPLPQDKIHALEQGLRNATGRQVVLEAKIDPSIIGGVVTRIGSTVYDGSVTTQLQKMRQALVEAGQ